MSTTLPHQGPNASPVAPAWRRTLALPDRSGPPTRPDVPGRASRLPRFVGKA